MGAKVDVAAVTDAGPPNAAVLWTGVLTAPMAWAGDLLIRYALVHWSCGTHQTIVLRLISGVTLLLVAAGGIVAWRSLQQTAPHAKSDEIYSLDRSRFMALLGVLTSVLFALVVIAGAVPQWVFDACD